MRCDLSLRRQFVLGGRVAAAAVAAVLVLDYGQAIAQQAAPATPPPVWSGNVAAGLAVTSGNADTSNFNLSAKVTHDPDNPHLLSADVFYLHGTNDGETIVSRTTFNIRDDYTLTERASLFGQWRYLRDTFKGIDYLTGPQFGISYKLVNLDNTKFNLDAGAGVIWEKNPVIGTQTSGAITLGENVMHRFSDRATFTHSATGLWKTSDFGDSLYTVSAGLAAAITERTQLKVELLELYKTLPPVGFEKQDLSFLTSVVYSF